MTVNGPGSKGTTTNVPFCKLNSSVGNDKISSMMVPAGYGVTLYQHGGYKGVTLDVAGNCECIRLDNKDNPANHSFNNDASSLKMW